MVVDVKAGQTVYFVWQDSDMYYHYAGEYKLKKFFIVEKNPYKGGQCLDHRLPRSYFRKALSSGLKPFTSRRKAIRYMNEMNHYLPDSK